MLIRAVLRWGNGKKTTGLLVAMGGGGTIRAGQTLAATYGLTHNIWSFQINLRQFKCVDV